MAQVNSVLRMKRVELAREGTYGTTPGTMYGARPKDPGFTITPTQEQFDNTAQSVREFDKLLNVVGLKRWTGSFPFDIRPETAQLDAAASPATTWMTELLRGACGGYSAAAGSTVDTAASGTSITVAAGHGSRFTVGTWIAVGVAGVLEPCKVTTISTDTLTVYPALSGTPATGQLVINGYNNWMTEAFSESIAITSASAQSSTLQYTLNNGIATELGFQIPETGKGLLSASCTLAGAKWTGPSNQSLSTSVVSEVLTAPFSVRDAYVLLQAPATTTRVAYPLISTEVRVMLGNVHIEELVGDNEQTSGTFRVADRMVASATLRTRYDQQIHAWYASQTQLTCAVIVPYGSGTTKRFVVFEMPTTFISAKPVDGEFSGRDVTTFELAAQLSTANSSQTVGTAAAPWVLARI